MAKAAARPKLLENVQNDHKAGATTQITSTSVYRPGKQCADCESINLKTLIDESRQASFSLTEMLQKQWCPHCRYICELIHYFGRVRPGMQYTVLMWPSSIGEYVAGWDDANSAWLIAPLVAPLHILSYLLGLRCEGPPGMLQRMTFWELGVALRPNECRPITTVAWSISTTGAASKDNSNALHIADCKSVYANFPRCLRNGVGFEENYENENYRKLSYPAAQRSSNHFGGEALERLQTNLVQWRDELTSMISGWASGISEDHTHIRTPLSMGRTGAQLANVPQDAEILDVSIKPAAKRPKFLEVLSARYEKDNVMTARRIDRTNPDWILARQWLSTCKIVHGDQCRPLQWAASTYSPFMLRVYDTRLRCIVQAPRHCRYAALSYTWGTMPQIRATMRQPFTRPGSLSANKCRLPKTVSDATTVCRCLGLRYLWVDRLCILQDSEEDKSAQFEHMGYVYSGAEVTLVAGYGSHADSGLPGVSDVPRCSAHFEAVIVDSKFRATPWNPLGILMQSPWYSRGWTYQELLFSKRLLCFTEQQMLFFCGKGVFREDLVLETVNGLIDGVRNMTSLIDRPLRLKVGSFGPQAACPDQWVSQAADEFASCATAYLQRNLTDEGDVLNAFAGVLEALMPYLGPYRWGLPVLFARSILTWHTQDRAPLPRREGFPSWSWVGWTRYRYPIRMGLRFGLAYGNVDQPLIFAFTKEGDLAPIEQINVLTGDGAEGQSSVGVLPEEVRLALVRPLDKYLVLLAKCAYLSVDREPSGTDNDEYGVRDAYGGGLRIAVIRLDPEWRHTQPDRLEFIISGTSVSHGLGNLMLIAREGPIAYRIQNVESANAMFAGVPSNRQWVVLG